MISGELIRLKNLVDDCSRMARVIQREYPNLDPGEKAELAEYIRKSAPKFEEAIAPASAPAETAESKSTKVIS